MAHPFESEVRPTVTMEGAGALTAADIAAHTVFVFDTGGENRDLVIPDASAANAGTFLVVAQVGDNDEVLTVKSDAQATIATLKPAETAFLVSTGALWVGGAVAVLVTVDTTGDG